MLRTPARLRAWPRRGDRSGSGASESVKHGDRPVVGSHHTTNHPRTFGQTVLAASFTESPREPGTARKLAGASVTGLLAPECLESHLGRSPGGSCSSAAGSL